MDNLDNGYLPVSYIYQAELTLVHESLKYRQVEHEIRVRRTPNVW